MAVGLLVATGTAWAFLKGAKDFEVFYHAWTLVLAGSASEIYSQGPDRYLYAPGFAWLFSPLAFLPKTLALTIWTMVKTVSLGLLIRRLASALAPQNVAALGLVCLAALFTARPILIDFEYGQVNLFTLAIALWALLDFYSERRNATFSFLAWFFLGIAAVTKLFTLPLLIIPFLNAPLVSSQRRAEKWGSVAGVLLMILGPAIFLNAGGSLYLNWRDALIAKGFPTESHNQSFLAFLHHYLSGNATAVLSEAGIDYHFGARIFSAEVLRWLGWAWFFGTLGILVGWIFSMPARFKLSWLAVLIGLLILPSHLIWKPYFVFSFPLFLAVMQKFSRTANFAWGWVGLTSLALVLNLSGFDVLGHPASAHLEAFAVFLWVHLALMVWVRAIDRLEI